jgi:hypothetical protein
MSRSTCRAGIATLALLASFSALAATGHAAEDPPTHRSDKSSNAGHREGSPVQIDPLQLMILLHLNGGSAVTLRSIPQPGDRACCEMPVVSN